jgi:hypothetical protein
MLRAKLATSLIAAAKVVAEDQSKERIQMWIRNTRVQIAKAIEPTGELPMTTADS